MREAVPSIEMHGCQECSRRWQTTYPGCPYCGSTAVAPCRASGLGRVYSWVEIFRSFEDPPATVPYSVVCVELTEGGRIFGRFLPGGEPQIGSLVQRVEHPEDLMVFTPVEDEE
jgi:uncharacterized protein